MATPFSANYPNLPPSQHPAYPNPQYPNQNQNYPQPPPSPQAPLYPQSQGYPEYPQTPPQSYPPAQYPPAQAPPAPVVIQEVHHPNNQQPYYYKPYEQPLEEHKEDVFVYKSADVRLLFIRKVLGILFFQFFLTGALITYSCFQKSYILFVIDNMWLYYCSIFVYIVTLYTLGCYQSCARSVPGNYFLLLLFTASFAYLTSIITAVADPTIVFIAGVLTVVVVGALTIYALTTSTDFTLLGGMLWVGALLLFAGGILAAIFHSMILEILCTVGGLFLFSLYLIYDIQLLVGNKELMYTLDDYIIAAMNIYIDIMRIFLYILRILMEIQRRN